MNNSWGENKGNHYQEGGGPNYRKIQWTFALIFYKNYQCFEKLYQTLEIVFHQISKHFGVKKNSAAPLFFNPLLSVSIPAETLFLAHEYYVNCGNTNEMKMWSSQLWLRFKQLSPKNVLGASTGFEPMASALDPYVGSRPIYWIHRTRERNETYEYYVNCGHTNEMKVWSSQLWLRFWSRWKQFSGLIAMITPSFHSS